VNFDDFIIDARIVHSDVFPSEESYNISDVYNCLNANRQSCIHSPEQHKSSLQKIVYDEDSPSDAVSLYTADKSAIPFKEKNESHFYKISLSQALYKKFCTFLI
jgi:hypothetical protein